MTDKLVAYLAYGSNLYPRRLAARVGEPVAARTVRIGGWALRFHKRSLDGSGKCDIVPAPDAHIYGVVYSLTLAAKRRLDQIEGVGFGYSSTEIHHPEHGLMATYRAHSRAVDGALRPYAWYHQLVVAGARHHGFPGDYMDSLHMVTPVEDPDPHRHAREIRVIQTACSPD